MENDWRNSVIVYFAYLAVHLWNLSDCFFSMSTFLLELNSYRGANNNFFSANAYAQLRT